MASAALLVGVASSHPAVFCPEATLTRWSNNLDGEQVEVVGAPQEGFGEAPYRMGGLWYPCVVVAQGRDRGCQPIGSEVMVWLDGPGWRRAS